MIIKISIPGVSEKYKPIDLLNYVSNSNIKIFINDPSVTDCDLFFIIEDIYCSNFENVNSRLVIFLGAETIYPINYFRTPWMIDFTSQFDFLFSAGFIQGKNVINTAPFLPWMFSGNHGSNYGCLDVNSLPLNSNLKYKNKISVICSNKQENDVQKLRFNFVKEIKSHFNDSIDWFGSGVNPIDIKSTAINKYKYHIVLENQIRNNLFSEKIYDSYLGLSMPIYSGAPNISRYFPENSFLAIDIYNIKESISNIDKIISSNIFDENIDSIFQARELVLHKYNILNRIIDIALIQDIKIPKSVRLIHSRRKLQRSFLFKNPFYLIKYKFKNYINTLLI